jgi:hypothetical protein
MGNGLGKTGFIPAKAGIHFCDDQEPMDSAWPFLETSPFGLVFAGMTI